MQSEVHFLLHADVIHRDIKPENILVDSSGEVQLANFGKAAFVPMGEVCTVGVATPAFRAPEMWQGWYSRPADMWSVGVLLYLLLTGRLPFQATCGKLTSCKSARHGLCHLWGHNVLDTLHDRVLQFYSPLHAQY